VKRTSYSNQMVTENREESNEKKAKGYIKRERERERQ